MKLNLGAENINYIKIVYKDGNDFSHCIKASVKRIDTVDILACVKLDEKIFIKTPQEVEIGIASDNGIYKAFSTLKYSDWQDPYEFLAVKIPDDIEYRQNREYFRVRLSDNADIIFTNEDESTYTINCKVYDLSANGVRFVLDSQTNIPEFVTVIIHFPERDINTQAKYVRSDSEDGIIKTSFEFVDLSPSDLDFISRICFKKQLEERRKTRL